MLPYLILVVSPFVFVNMAIKDKLKLRIGKSEFVKKNNLAISAFFFFFFVILSLRHYTIGNDIFWYKWSFENSATKSLQSIWNEGGDILYYSFAWLIRKVTDNFQIFLSIVSGLILVPVYMVYKQDKRHSILKLMLFINMATFIMFFSGLRQSVAIAIGMICYKYTKERKLLKFIIAVLIAIGFHHSAFILIVMYPLYHYRVKIVHMLFVAPVMVGIFVFNKPIFGVTTTILNVIFGTLYETSIKPTGAYSSLVLFSVFLIFSFVVVDEKKCNAETLGMRNFLIFATMLQFFVPLHSLAMRMNYYYVIFVPYAMAKFMCVPKKRYEKVAKIAEVIIIVYFLQYYLRGTYENCVTGISSLNIYPYKVFWSN